MTAYNVTGLAASVALATTTTTSGSTAETGTASSGTRWAGRGDVTLLAARVAGLSSGSGALSREMALLTASVTGRGARLIVSSDPTQEASQLTWGQAAATWPATNCQYMYNKSVSDVRCILQRKRR